MKIYNFWQWFLHIDQTLLHSWWVIFLLLVCLFAWEQERKISHSINQSLAAEVHLLEEQKKHALMTKKDLQEQLNSWEDRDWIEQVLIQHLRVIPEGQRKFYFTSE